MQDNLDQQELINLLQRLQSEKLKFNQEKLSQKIISYKSESAAELIAGLLYSEDVYIRNTAIEMLIAMGECALEVLSEKAADGNRNIRKFALDALKNIPGKHSCEMAMAALDDKDENVVVVALEVIAHQKYKEAEHKLLCLLGETYSLWILNELIRTFASLELKQHVGVIEEKILALDVTDLEKNLLANTFVESLGSLGSARHIPHILHHYSKAFTLDEDTFIGTLRNLVIKSDVSELSQKTVEELGQVFKAHWDCRDSDKIMDAMGALVKLQMDFFLDDIEEIYDLNRDKDFFSEDLFSLTKNLQVIPEHVLYKLLKSNEPGLVVLGLRLVHEKRMMIDAGMVEMLCRSADGEVAQWANEIAAEFISLEELMHRLDHKSMSIRKTAARRLGAFSDKVSVDFLENIIKDNPGEEGLEALETLFNINESKAWEHINSRMDTLNDNVRIRLIEMVTPSQDEAFYRFMTTMINDPSSVVRRKAIKVLSKRMDEKSLSLLMGLNSAESDSFNKSEIISALYKYDDVKAIDIIHRAAFATDAFLRLAAVRALRHMDSHFTVEILEKMQNDPVDEVQEAAKEALLIKGRQDVIIR